MPSATDGNQQAGIDRQGTHDLGIGLQPRPARGPNVAEGAREGISPSLPPNGRLFSKHCYAANTCLPQTLLSSKNGSERFTLTSCRVARRLVLRRRDDTEPTLAIGRSLSSPNPRWPLAHASRIFCTNFWSQKTITLGRLRKKCGNFRRTTLGSPQNKTTIPASDDVYHCAQMPGGCGTRLRPRPVVEPSFTRNQEAANRNSLVVARSNLILGPTQT